MVFWGQKFETVQDSALISASGCCVLLVEFFVVRLWGEGFFGVLKPV